jgi:chaperonin GroEL
VGGAGEKSAIAARVQQLQTRLAQLEGEYDRENMEKRIAKLSGGVAVIQVGAATEPEMKERKARVDDALSATRAAALEGIVPGGGVALVRCIQGLDQLEVSAGEKAGVDVLRRALEEPLRRIAENGGVEGSIVVQAVLDSKEPNFGYNAATGVYEDLVKAGVIDPTKVARVALCHAASIASLMLTTEAMVGRHTAVRASSSGLQSELSGS